MRTVLVDTDVLIEVLRDRDPAITSTWLRAVSDDTLVSYTPVTAAEIEHGARAQEREKTHSLMAALTCLPIDAECGRRAGEYLRQFRKSHALELGDALIAAAAAVHQLPLWTRNRKHFPMRDLVFFED